MDFNTYDCGYIGGWSIADDEEKEKIIDASNSIPEEYLVSTEEAEKYLKAMNDSMNLSIKNAKFQPFIKYQDQLEEVIVKLRNVNICLKTLCFMLEQYSLPDEENNVTKFDSTQDMAKYFKLIADMCLKISEFD